MPAGSNSVGVLGANSGVDIGDVTINNASGGSAVNIQDGGNSITVDGTVAATQSGTWNVNNVSGTVSLPTGAATAAKQPALGTAGTASSDVITVQGIASMTALVVDGSTVTQPVSDAGGSLTVDGTVAATQSGTWNVGTVTTVSTVTSVTAIANALPAGTNNIGDVDVLTLPSLPAGTNNIGDVDVLSLPALPAGSNSIGTLGANSGVDIGDVTINNASGASAVNIQDGGNSITIDGSITVSNSTGGSAVNIQDGGNSITVDGTVSAQLTPQTSGGLSISKTVSAASTNATSAKASAGQVFGWSLSNVNAAARYLKLYNKASAPTVGTDTPVMTIVIPGNTAGAGNNFIFDTGIAFATGIAYALTTEATDAGSTGVAANEIVVNLYYK